MNISDSSKFQLERLPKRQRKARAQPEHFRYLPTYPDFYKFNRGIEAGQETAVQPCDKEFLDALLRHLAALVRAFVHHNPPPSKSGFMGQSLSELNQKILRYFRIVMKQCQRLKAFPKLFPCDCSRQDFFGKVAVLTRIMANYREIFQSYEDLAVKVHEYLPWKFISKDESGKIVEERALPPFFPGQPGGKNPWNYWLDNSAKGNDGWIAIQQKIPQVGDTIIRHQSRLYESLETQFEAEQSYTRDRKDANANIGEPGDAYKHMTWSQFQTVGEYDLGFERGWRKKHDSNGIRTLESLEVDVFRSRVEPYSQALPSNCPYFKFAVAYKP
ncbi:hypothetical protein BP5796_10361 [Coleophoma crateriformis]|uniref:Uncharacterized protein n=1 Tax=Coleophoma crateriformis TaxID=565419 RepID=A0A3D8QPX8_9HELO|nr:hypothetical protein BP5796_10361 [Coleophoma crateriformis]